MSRDMDMMYWFCVQYQQQRALQYERSITEVLRKRSAQIGGLNWAICTAIRYHARAVRSGCSG